MSVFRVSAVAFFCVAAHPVGLRNGAIAVAILVLSLVYSWQIQPRLHLQYVKMRSRNKGLAVFSQPPFAVISDEEEETARTRLGRVVPLVAGSLGAVGLMKRPRRGLTICLFKEWKNYQHCSEQLARRKRPWRGGSFLPRQNAVVADVSGGNAVLFHELAHALVHANIPHCPVWLDEGLACLVAGRFDDRDGGGWQRDRVFSQMLTAVRENRALPLERLCAMSFRAFHIDDEARNYSEATCLCYRLHDRALLKEYCRRFRKNRRRDPTGYKTLTALLGCADIEGYQWEAFLNMVDIQNLQHRP
jgi:hypothetical protein